VGARARTLCGKLDAAVQGVDQPWVVLAKRESVDAVRKVERYPPAVRVRSESSSDGQTHAVRTMVLLGGRRLRIVVAAAAVAVAVPVASLGGRANQEAAANLS
jgi:hypothetical protein